jgi:hypothetical protein
MPQAQRAVCEGLANGEFPLADVAARFVGLMYTVGGSTTIPSAASFDGSLFTKLTGIAAETLEHSERGEWSDISWPRRRAFAMKFVHEGGADAAPDGDGAENSGRS